MKYHVYGTVVGSKYLGEFEAASEEEAIEKASNEAYVSFCHQCSQECENAEVTDIVAEVSDDQ